MEIDNWFCNLFGMDSNDLKWLEARRPAPRIDRRGRVFALDAAADAGPRAT